MINATTEIRVRYSETDQMGFVYYGNYAQYLEIGRVEALKTIGLSYKKIEEMGYMLPVKDLNIKYLRAAQYDDVLIIKTYVKKKPTNRIVFEYEIYKEDNLLITAETTLFFIDSSKRACKPPSFFVDQLKPFFN